MAQRNTTPTQYTVHLRQVRSLNRFISKNGGSNRKQSRTLAFKD